jgi:hypothetical protein
MSTRDFGTILTAPAVAGSDSRDDMAVAYNAEIGGAFQRFNTAAERDAWASAYKSRLFGTTAFVESPRGWFKWNGVQVDGSDGTWEVVPGLDVGGGGSTSSLSVTDNFNTVGDVRHIRLEGATITGIPGQDGVQPGEIVLTAGMNVHMDAPSSQPGRELVTELAVIQPLSVYPDQSKPTGVKLEIAPGTFEPLQPPSFLAYLRENEEIVGKEHNTTTSHFDGTLWFDDIVVPHGPYIVADPDGKAYGIQEADELDPLVSGGAPYLVILRIQMKGKAPNDGFVRAYMSKRQLNPQQPSGYMEDVNGRIMAAQRNYKAGEELGVIEVMGIVSASGLQEFTCHVMDNFADDVVMLEDRANGGSGLMIQALTATGKTGLGLIQFQIDTAQVIKFSSHYLGESRASIVYLVTSAIPVRTGTPGDGMDSIDGMHLYNLTALQAGVVDDHMHFQDDGGLCDFSFGKVFSAEETGLLRDKEVKLSVTITTPSHGFTAALVKWTGAPDEYTKKIFQSRTDDEPNFDAGWALAASALIPLDAQAVDREISHVFTVPDDANNYAVILYPTSPSATLPLTMELMSFDVDVVAPFTGFVLHSSEQLYEYHLRNSSQHRSLVFTDQGLGYGIRYTINSNDIPMPMGDVGSGAADVTLDKTKNLIVGSQATKGEGALVMGADGKLTIKTELHLFSELANTTHTYVTFWYARLYANGTMAQIDDSTTLFDVEGKTDSVYTMREFTIDVQAGDMIVLRARADRDDGAYLFSNSPSAPLLNTTLTFEEVVTAAPDPFETVDLTQFGAIYNGGITATKDVADAASVTIPIDVPSAANLVVLSAVKKLADQSVRPVAKLDWSYNNVAKTLTVSFGETVALGRITLGLYL